MYDSYIYCEEYRTLKNIVVSLTNGYRPEKEDLEEAGIEADADGFVDMSVLSEKVQSLYDDGQMPSSQYDDLMRYIQDLEN